MPGPPQLRARSVAGGWLLTGSSPWVTGWNRIDVFHTAARDGEQVVWSLVDARASHTLEVTPPFDLVAVRASATVRVQFRDHFVPDERVTGTRPYESSTAPEVLRIHAALALGVAGRCCRLLGSSRLDDELAESRNALDRATAETMPAARAAASDLALRAAASLVSSVGSRSLLPDQHAQRLAREALFLLVFGSRPAVRAELLGRLGASRGAAVSARPE